MMESCGTRAEDRRWSWRDDCDLSDVVNSVHLWRVRLDRDDSSVRKLGSLLSEEERQRARKYRFTLDRKRFIVRRGMLRRILGRYLGAEPKCVRLRVGEFGKPYLADPCGSRVDFNVTHSWGMSIVAVTRTGWVGVDLERLQQFSGLKLMIDSCLSRSERRDLEAFPPTLRLERFYRYWTCKEAYLKALGVGLDRRLSSLQVSLTGTGTDHEAKLLGEELTNFSMKSFVPFEGYVAAVVVPRECTPHDVFTI